MAALLKKLSILDRLLTPAILLCMIGGVLIGNFVPGVQDAFDTARFHSVSARKRPQIFPCVLQLIGMLCN